MARQQGVRKIGFLRSIPSNYADAKTLRIIESTRVKVNEFDDRLINSVSSSAEMMRGAPLKGKSKEVNQETACFN